MDYFLFNGGAEVEREPFVADAILLLSYFGRFTALRSWFYRETCETCNIIYYKWKIYGMVVLGYGGYS